MTSPAEMLDSACAGLLGTIGELRRANGLTVAQTATVDRLEASVREYLMMRGVKDEGERDDGSDHMVRVRFGRHAAGRMRVQADRAGHGPGQAEDRVVRLVPRHGGQQAPQR